MNSPVNIAYDDAEISTPNSQSSPQNSVVSSDTDVIININLDNENINIENVEAESNLVEYTNNSFYVKSKHTPEWHSITDVSFHSTYILSNSPVNSCDNSINSDSNLEANVIHSSNNFRSENSNPAHFRPIVTKSNTILNYSEKDVSGFVKLSYHDVEKFINKYYNVNPDNKYSNELDILITYINGQKNLYIQSKYVTQYKLNLLTFPSIFITAATTIIAPFVDCQWWNGILISGLNAVILFLISLINYLKYETDIENYLQNVKQYDKLETSLEMANNKLMFIEKDRDKNLLVLSKLKETEKKMNEIKESNTSLIPEEIKRIFPVISTINVFSFIKKIEIGKRELINKLRDVKNEIRFILYKWEQIDLVGDNTASPVRRMSQVQNIEHLKERNRLQFLYEVKNNLKQEILDLMNAYTYIDTIFLKEINIANSRKKCSYFLFSYFYTSKRQPSYLKTDSAAIDKYFGFIFADS
jgi:hypothetical protein